MLSLRAGHWHSRCLICFYAALVILDPPRVLLGSAFLRLYCWRLSLVLQCLYMRIKVRLLLFQLREGRVAVCLHLSEMRIEGCLLLLELVDLLPDRWFLFHDDNRDNKP